MTVLFSHVFRLLLRKLEIVYIYMIAYCKVVKGYTNEGKYFKFNHK